MTTVVIHECVRSVKHCTAGENYTTPTFSRPNNNSESRVRKHGQQIVQRALDEQTPSLESDGADSEGIGLHDFPWTPNRFRDRVDPV